LKKKKGGARELKGVVVKEQKLQREYGERRLKFQWEKRKKRWTFPSAGSN